MRELLLRALEVVQVDRYAARNERRRISVDILRIVLAVILPPLGVFLQVGLTKHFWINVLLTLLGYVPGLVHAVWVIATFPRKEWSSS